MAAAVEKTIKKTIRIKKIRKKQQDKNQPQNGNQQQKQDQQGQDKQQQQQAQQQRQISNEEAQKLLEAIGAEEGKVQQKLSKDKNKPQKSKTQKDW
jgi:Ca-activated chloride channel family protein